MQNFLRDLRYSARVLIKSRAFSAVTSQARNESRSIGGAQVRVNSTMFCSRGETLWNH